MMALDGNSPVPIFQQIADHIRRSVAAGVYQPGEAVPSTRALALDLAVNPNTVQRAYEQLEREGLIFVKRGVGVFVAEKGPAAAREQSAGSLHEAFKRAIQAGQFARLSAEGIESIFRRALADTQNGHGQTGGGV